MQSLCYIPAPAQREIHILAPRIPTLGKPDTGSTNTQILHTASVLGMQHCLGTRVLEPGVGLVTQEQGGEQWARICSRLSMQHSQSCLQSHSRCSQCFHLIPKPLTLNRHISQTTAIIHHSYPSACWSYLQWVLKHYRSGCQLLYF